MVITRVATGLWQIRLRCIVNAGALRRRSDYGEAAARADVGVWGPIVEHHRIAPCIRAQRFWWERPSLTTGVRLPGFCLPALISARFTAASARA